MTLPPPVAPAPPPPNRLAMPAIAVGVGAVVLSFVAGIFMMRVHPNVALAVPVLTGIASIAVGAASLVAASRRRGLGFPAGIVGIVLGTATLAALFLGRVFAAEVLGFS